MRSADLGSVRLWAYPIVLAGVALGFDAAYRGVQFGLLSTGPLDEVAHLATAALGLLALVCFIDVPRRFYVAALAASVAVDLDHIPLYLGLLGAEDQRRSHIPWPLWLWLGVLRRPVAGIGLCWQE